jgi:hypothetical protein
MPNLMQGGAAVQWSSTNKNSWLINSQRTLQGEWKRAAKARLGPDRFASVRVYSAAKDTSRGKASIGNGHGGHKLVADVAIARQPTTNFFH